MTADDARGRDAQSAVLGTIRAAGDQRAAALATSSHDTALRDIQRLIDLGLLKKDSGGGRSTSYSINEG